MAVDTELQELIFQEVTQEEFDTLDKAGQTGLNQFYLTPDLSTRLPIFTSLWVDHKVNDMSWLNADTFSWQSGDVYVAAYEHLASEVHIENLYAWEEEEGRNRYTRSATPSVGDPVYTASGSQISTVESVGTDYIVFNGTTCPRNSGGDILGTNAETDTVDDITITFYRAEDGHKICLADQEANVQAIYEATGVAWYYILDTENKQFKLPRTKHAFTGLRDSVGGYVKAGLPNITGGIYNILGESHKADGVFSIASTWTHDLNATASGAVESGANYYFDASSSSPVYGNSNTVQPEATQMYLYFFVGNYTKSAIEQTAGITSEQLNNKADISDVQALETRTGALEQGDYVVASQEPTSSNGYTWYRKYKSGWVEQGGRWSGTRTIAQGESGNVTPSLPIKMANKYYYVNAACEDIFCLLMNTNAEVHQCTFGWGAYSVGRTLSAFIWEVKGFAA